MTPASAETGIDSTLAYLPTSTKSNYAFNGWFTAETGGEMVTSRKKYSANTTIYAQWIQTAFVVTLDPNGGTVTPTTVNIGESGRIVSLPDPIKAGYTFDGWFTVETDGEKVAEDYVLSGDIIIYAHWTYYNSVTEITGIPNKIKINEQFPLIGTVVPENAENKTIVWSVENAGTTNAGIYDGVLFAMSEGYIVLKATIADGKAAGVPYEQYFFINAVVSVAASNRDLPSPRHAATSSISPSASPLSAAFAAGPNPAVRSSVGALSFFRAGALIKSADLSVYDASGNVVRRLIVKDGGAAGGRSRRKVGSWDLRDARGRLVSEGTYLVSGAVKTKDGKQERVSLVVGVR